MEANADIDIYHFFSIFAKLSSMIYTFSVICFYLQRCGKYFHTKELRASAFLFSRYMSFYYMHIS